MSFKVEENVLHIEYKKEEDIPLYIKKIADKYEGEMKNRIGFNFPMSFVKETDKEMYKNLIKK